MLYNIFNPFLAKLPYLNFHRLELVSRHRDPQLQVQWLTITYISLFLDQILAYLDS